jgi:SpoVK/Ycf46/Vps4 family AAA+-type ATPase
VDEAAGYALADNRKIQREDLLRALDGSGGRDRPNLEVVDWDEVVIEESVQQDLKSLIRLLEDPVRTRSLGLEVPTGLMLVGLPGTGKTLIARLIASQTRRSFYSLSAANVLGGGVGDSVKRVAGVFSRAKENSPAIIFLDEMDGLLPANSRYLSQHDIQLVEQFLTEISSLEPDNNVFLVGTTNLPDSIDPRVLRGGRFSEKIQIDPPATANRIRLISKYLNGTRLDASLSISNLAEYLDGLAPADIQAVCIAAKRMSFNRSPRADQLPPLNRFDFEKAFERVRGGMVKADGTGSRW